MSGFDLVFALFGLVLGLAVTEVLAGFSRVLKMRGKAHIGWLVPLLGLLVLLDLTSFWMQAFALREYMPANLLTLFVVLAIVGSYYLVATLIFPDDPEAWPDFDLYYDRFNRRILGGMLGINIASLVASVVLIMVMPEPSATAEPEAGLWSTIFEVAPVVLIPALMLVRGRRANLALLVLLIADFMAMAVADVLGV